MDYHRLFEGAPAALLVLDPQLTIVGASDAYLALTATGRDEIVGRPVFEVFPDNPEDADATGVSNLRASLMRVREYVVVDVMPVQKYPMAVPGSDGFTTRYWAQVNTPVLHADGGLGWIIHRVDDVTAYVLDQVGDVAQQDLDKRLRPTLQAQSQVFDRQFLQDQNHALLAILNSLDTAVVGCDRVGRAVLANRSARELFTLPAHVDAIDRWAQRFSGFSFFDTAGNIIASDDLPTQMLLRGEPVRGMQIIAKAEAAAPRTLLVHGQPVTDGGRLAAVIAVHEITRQRRAEILKECEQQVAKVLAKPEPADTVIANAVELIGNMLGWAATEFWTVDEVGQVLRRKACWSTAGHTVLNDLPDRLEKGSGVPGASWADSDPIWTTDLSTDPSAATQTSNWNPLRSSFAVPLPSGASVLGVLVCYSDNHETPDDMRTAVMTGIAAHLGEFLERRRAEQYAAELETTRDEYIALVGHELRTPLTSIQSYTDMMRTDPDLSTDEREQMLEVVHRRTLDLQTLIAKLLDVAGTRSGHITLQIRPVNLTAILTDAADRARNCDPPVTVDLNTPAHVIIDADPDRLRGVIDELLRNALTWAPDNTTVGVTLHADDHTAVIAVSNTGARIPADEHARIFDLFYRTKNTLNNGIPGTGLGLTLARAVTEQHGGTITVSEPDEAATTFTVRLPVHHHTTTQRPPGC